MSLTGASGKVGLYYDSMNNEWYLPGVNAPSTHIVKQSHVRLDGIVTNILPIRLLTNCNSGKWLFLIILLEIQIITSKICHYYMEKI